MAIGINGINFCAHPHMLFLTSRQDAIDYFTNCSCLAIRAFAFDETTMRIKRILSLAEATQFYAPANEQRCICGKKFSFYADGSYEHCVGCGMENPAIPRK